jgi:hypothetical protein
MSWLEVMWIFAGAFVVAAALAAALVLMMRVLDLF